MNINIIYYGIELAYTVSVRLNYSLINICNDVLHHNFWNNLTEGSTPVADYFFLAGQMLSAVGLAYGGFLSLVFCYQADDMREVHEKAILLHHLAMA
jgi:hypothetical protein